MTLGELNEGEPRSEINMNVDNSNLNGSTSQSQEVPGTSTEPRHPAIDNVKDGSIISTLV